MPGTPPGVERRSRHRTAGLAGSPRDNEDNPLRPPFAQRPVGWDFGNVKNRDAKVREPTPKFRGGHRPCDPEGWHRRRRDPTETVDPQYARSSLSPLVPRIHGKRLAVQRTDLSSGAQIFCLQGGTGAGPRRPEQGPRARPAAPQFRGDWISVPPWRVRSYRRLGFHAGRRCHHTE